MGAVERLVQLGRALLRRLAGDHHAGLLAGGHIGALDLGGGALQAVSYTHLGEWLGAFGLTEPGAGTDAQGQQTTAVLDESGENWVLNGSKIFITNAGYANVFIIFAITGEKLDKRGRKSKEISAFIVERTDPGLSLIHI